VPTDPATGETRQTFARWLPLFWAALGVGILARSVRYLPNWPLWGDEAALAYSFPNRDFLALLGPLEYCQVASVGYLWAVKAAISLGGFHALAMRSVAIFCSVAALLILYRVVRQMNAGTAGLLAVAVLAVSHYPIRHAAEIKPYATDLFVTTLLIAGAVGTFRGRWSAAWALLLGMPFALLSSLPAVFVAGGIAAAALPSVMERRSAAWWSWLVAYGCVVAVSFVGMYKLILQPQLAAHGVNMSDHWASAFIDVSSPLAFGLWVLQTLTGVVFAYPIGGENGASIVSAVFFWIGLVTLWQRQQRSFVVLVLATVALALVAAALQKYPFGQHARIVQYFAPLACVPIGFGLARLIEVFNVNEERRERATRLVFLTLLLIGLGNVTKDLISPYYSRESREIETMARWVWTSYASEKTLVNTNAAWHAEFAADIPTTRFYETHRLMFAGTTPSIQQAIPKSIAGRVGLVVCTQWMHRDHPGFAAWQTALSEHYTVVETDEFPAMAGQPSADVYTIVWIEPKP
jgi:4-amino-4-deoxy-L-arabinose transferase-like glycosyltransferase